jgi:hypothetical protein
MKLELIVANEGALKTLIETQFEDHQLVWDLACAFDNVEEAIKRFQKQRDELIKEVGTPDKENPTRFNIDDQQAFSDKMQKMLDVEVDIVFPKITLNQLKGIQVSIKDMRSWKALGLILDSKIGLKDIPKEEVQQAEEVTE